ILRDAQVRRWSQVHVVRTEAWARADRDGTGRCVNPARAKVRLPRCGAGVHLIANAFELAAAYVGEIFARWARRRALVEEDGNLQIAANALTQRASEHDTVFHRRAFERN